MRPDNLDHAGFLLVPELVHLRNLVEVDPCAITNVGSSSPFWIRAVSWGRYLWTRHWPVFTVRPRFMSEPSGNLSARPM